jgi:hypothetical protein
MDPVTIATGALAILVPYLKRGAEEFTAAAGEVAYQKTKALLADLKRRWSGDREAIGQLEQLERNPDRYRPVVEDILKEKLQGDPGLAQQLTQYLQDVGPTIDVVQRLKDADTVVGVDTDEGRGTMRVTQEIDKSANVTGVRIRRT